MILFPKEFKELKGNSHRFGRLSVRIGVAAGIFLVPLLSGCGGGKSVTGPAGAGVSAQRASATFTVQWPEKSGTRVVPLASRSLTVTLTPKPSSSASVPVKKTVSAPEPGAPRTTTVSFSDLLVGEYEATAETFPTIEGTGTVQSFAKVPVTIISGKTNALTMTMDATVKRLIIHAGLLARQANLLLRSDAQRTLTVEARDGNSRIVLVHPEAIRWSSESGSITTVDQDGIVKSVGAGTTNIKASYTEPNVASGEQGTGAQATLPVTVAPKSYAVSFLQPPQGFTLPGKAFLNNQGEVAGVLKPNTGTGDRLFVRQASGQMIDQGMMPGYTGLEVSGINDSGAVCGTAVRVNSSTGIGELRAFIWRQGQFQDLGVPSNSRANRINNAGTIIGSYQPDVWTASRAFIWQNGQYSLVNSQDMSFAEVISNNGEIIGGVGNIPDLRKRLYQGFYTTFLIDSASFRSYQPRLADPSRQRGFNFPSTFDINDSGLLVGRVPMPYGDTLRLLGSACYWNDDLTGPQFLDPLEAGMGTQSTHGAANGLNNSAIIVGYCGRSDEMVAARWLLGEKRAENLNALVPALGANSNVLQEAWDINEAGQIVGLSRQGVFLLTPLR